ncbi:MAG: hypothetical protein J5898_00925 [Lachnospiraceae bacterium]|nr:hypothetical protein [Lachnospiraceae bacterium]
MSDTRASSGLVVGADFMLAGERFSGQVCHICKDPAKGGKTKDTTILGGEWHSETKTVGIETLLDAFHVKLNGLEKLKTYDFRFDKIGLWVTDQGNFQIRAGSKTYGVFTFLKKEKNVFAFKVDEIPQKMYFCELPIIGKYFKDTDHIGLNKFGFDIGNDGIEDLFFELGINAFKVSYGNPDESLKEQDSPDAEDAGCLGILLRRDAVMSGEASNKSPIHWMNVNKVFGPVRIVRFGIGYDDGCVVAAGDVDVKITCLSFNLIGLSIQIPFGNKDSKVSFGISGLGIDFSSGETGISGALMKEYGVESYSGQIAVRVGKFGLTILGNYEKTQQFESLFAFGALHAVLGGPPCFVVTGLSVGFGMNKNIVLPKADKLKDFPLVLAAMGDPAWEKKSPGDVLAGMRESIVTEYGETMLALGITFTTFQIITSCLIGLITFGNDDQIALLGQSLLDLPARLPGSQVNPYIHIGIGLRTVYNFKQGILTIDGAISEGSYIFCEKCKVSGGFAWYMWFKGEHKGDFVLTVGGYHKDFKPPEHYPTPDRVGINWNITDGLTLQGNAYFALTPSCIMAGGALNLTYVRNRLSAWVKFNADMIISWLPFYYDINADATVGASYTFKIFGHKKTVKLETAVGLHMWGPDFSIEIYVKWYIISFTIKSVQKSTTGHAAVSWDEFSATLLDGGDSKLAASAGLKPAQNASGAYVDIQVSNGCEEDNVILVKKGNPLLELSSKVPVTKLFLGNENTEVAATEKPLGVLPMGAMKILEHRVVIKMFDEKNQEVDYGWMKSEMEYTSVPKSLWGLTPVTVPSAEMIEDVLNAASFSFKEREVPETAVKYRMEDVMAPKNIRAHQTEHILEEEERDNDAKNSTDYREVSDTVSRVRESCGKFCKGGEWDDFIGEIDVNGLGTHPDGYFKGSLLIKEIGKKGK